MKSPFAFGHHHKDKFKEITDRPLSIGIGKLTADELISISKDGRKLYKENKEPIKSKFFDILKSPEKHGYEGEEAEGLKEISKEHSTMGWKLTKGAIKGSLDQLSVENVTELLLKDLEDAKIPIVGKFTFKAILDNPNDPDFNLEPEMIKHITKLDSEGKKALWTQIASVKSFTETSVHITDGHHLVKFEHKIVEVSTKLWENLHPILSKFMGVLAEIGFGLLAGLVTKNVKGPLKSSLTEAVQDTGDVVSKLFKEDAEKHSANSSKVDAEQRLPISSPESKPHSPAHTQTILAPQEDLPLPENRQVESPAALAEKVNELHLAGDVAHEGQ